MINYLDSTATNLYDKKCISYQTLNTIGGGISGPISPAVNLTGTTMFSVFAKNGNNLNAVLQIYSGSTPGVVTTKNKVEIFQSFLGVSYTTNGATASITNCYDFNVPSISAIVGGSGTQSVINNIDLNIYSGTNFNTLVGRSTGVTNTNLNSIGFGKQSLFDYGGEILEIVVYDRVLSTPEYNGVLTYLKNKYSYSTWIAPYVDADAQNYINAVIATGGTLNNNQKLAINKLFINLKDAGLYNSLDVFYPMMGGTSGSTSLNAIRTNSQFDITWNNVSNFTFNSSGVTNNGSGYGNTNYNPSVQSSPTNNGYGYYIVGGNIGGGNGEVLPLAAYDGSINSPYQNSGANVIGIYGYTNLRTGTDITFTGSSYNGSYIATINSTPIKSLYYNYSNLGNRQTTSGSPIGTSALPNQPYYMFVLNLNGAPYTGQFYTGRFQFAFMGDTLTSAQVETIDDIINEFQTELGRNTYGKNIFDADAQIYLDSVISAGGTGITLSVSAATNTLFQELKSAGIYNSLLAFYPVLGGTQNSTALNGNRTNSAYDITWRDPSQMTFEYSGVSKTNGNADTGGGNTFIIPNSNLTIGNRHMCMYVNKDNGIVLNGYEMGGGAGAENVVIFNYNNGGTGYFAFGGGYKTYAGTNTGFAYTQLSGSTSPYNMLGYKNGVQVINTTSTDAMGAKYLSVLCDNRTAVPGFDTGSEATDKRMCWASYGDNLSLSKLTQYETIINTFQTTLGRNTY